MHTNDIYSIETEKKYAAVCKYSHTENYVKRTIYFCGCAISSKRTLSISDHKVCLVRKSSITGSPRSSVASYQLSAISVPHTFSDLTFPTQILNVSNYINWFKEIQLEWMVLQMLKIVVTPTKTWLESTFKPHTPSYLYSQSRQKGNWNIDCLPRKAVVTMSDGGQNSHAQRSGGGGG